MKWSDIHAGTSEEAVSEVTQAAIKRRDKDGETLRSIGRSYNVSGADDFEANKRET